MRIFSACNEAKLSPASLKRTDVRKFSAIENFLRMRYKKTTYFAGICIFVSIVLNLMARYLDGFAQWYAIHIYPVFPFVFGRFFSLWKISFFEAGIYLIVLAAVLLIFIMIITFFSTKTAIFPGSKTRNVWARILLCFLAFIALTYTLTASINYQRDNIGTVLKLPVADASVDQLKKLNLLLVEDLTDLTDDPDWDFSSLTVQDMDYLETAAESAMKLLGKKEPTLSGYYPRPKPVYFSELLSSLGIDGIFSPFTIEANFNTDIPAFLIPYSICHEYAHLKGYMKEDDAGFIAYLACRNSPSKVIQYSGIFQTLIFSLNALKAESVDAFNEIYQELPGEIKNQLGYVRQQRQMQASSFTDISRSFNDAYLKANAQSGTKSYGGIVDLLIAEFADRIETMELI